MNLKISSARCRPFCFGPDVFIDYSIVSSLFFILISHRSDLYNRSIAFHLIESLSLWIVDWPLITTGCFVIKSWFIVDISTRNILESQLINIHMCSFMKHDDVIKWKHFPRYWPFVRGILRSPVNSLHKGQWRGALMFTLICARINGWVNNREAGEARAISRATPIVTSRGAP